MPAACRESMSVRLVPQWRPAPGDKYREPALRGRPAGVVQDLQGHDLRDDARGRIARARGCWPASRRTCVWQRGEPVTAPGARRSTLTGDATRLVPRRRAAAAWRCADAGAVLMRKDPPFDSEYFYATHLLEPGRARGRARLQQAGGAARPPREARDPGVPAVHRADAGHAQRGRRSSASTPSTATSSSSRWTAWAAWASSASDPTA